jgi:protein-L-isoaspartate O-methyltransferase
MSEMSEQYADQRAHDVAWMTAAERDASGRQPSAESPAVITIRHTHEDGTLVHGTSKGDGVLELIGPRTAARFRYFPSIRKIGIPQSRDHLAKRWQIDMAAEALRKAGFEVTVEIDDTPRDVAEVKEDRAERLDARYDRLTAAAQRNSEEAEQRWARAHEIADARNGQPRLAGHHSARRWDADEKRLEQNERAATAAFREAERAAAAASVVGSADAYRELPPVIIRRIGRLEAELRQTMHHINGTRPANDPDAKPASGDRLEQLEARKAFLEHQLEADRAALAEHEAAGYVRLTRETVHKGDRVFWGATWGDGIGGAIVTRTNPKTVTLDRTRYPRTLPYEQIKKVECPHDGTETTVRAPKRRTPRREPVPVTVERPAERPEPLTVDASTEFFATPPAVVDRMIAVAGLEAGMTVLEPSAGLGAIASRVAPLVASVECIERDSQLASRLRAASTWAGDVLCADFLEVPPAPVYDRVLMNPPFSRQADIRHVTHAYEFVKPGGRVVAVMSAGAEFRQGKTAEGFRKMVADRGGRIERLPDDAFAGAGISVRTVMAVIPA